MRITDILTDPGRFIPVTSKMANWLGWQAAAFLGQILYWQDKVSDEAQGWVYKSAEELQLETSLTYFQQKTARRHLLQKGLIQERNDRLAHRMHYRVDLAALREAWEAREAMEESDVSGLKKVTEPVKETDPGVVINFSSSKEEMTHKQTHKTGLSVCESKDGGLPPPRPPAQGLAPAPHFPLATMGEHGPGIAAVCLAVDKLHRARYGTSMKFQGVALERAVEFLAGMKYNYAPMLLVIVKAWDKLNEVKPEGHRDPFYFCRQLGTASNMFKLHPVHGIHMVVGAARELKISLYMDEPDVQAKFQAGYEIDLEVVVEECRVEMRAEVARESEIKEVSAASAQEETKNDAALLTSEEQPQPPDEKADDMAEEAAEERAWERKQNDPEEPPPFDPDEDLADMVEEKLDLEIAQIYPRKKIAPLAEIVPPEESFAYSV